MSLPLPIAVKKFQENFRIILVLRKATVALQKKFVAGVAHLGHETLNDALLRLIAEDRS